jgi:hypothetical protein
MLSHWFASAVAMHAHPPVISTDDLCHRFHHHHPSVLPSNCPPWLGRIHEEAALLLNPSAAQHFAMAEEDTLIVIASGGDLILDVSQEEGGQQFAYRVDSKTLRSTSRYFDNLLSDRFSEGQQLIAALEALKIAGYSDVADAPLDALPHIPIVNVGRIAVSKASNIQNLTADFLRAVHGQYLAVATPPVANLANLAVVADRFDAVDSLTIYVHRKKYLQMIDAKSKSRTAGSVSEERARQKLLVGLLFDHPSWTTRYSKHLIMRDSDQWRPGVEEDFTKALWWDLPNGLEGGCKHSSG